MAKIPPIVPISDLRRDISGVLSALKQGGEPVVITQRGRAAAVLLDVADYERVRYERELLLALVRGEREIEAGDTVAAEDVFAEAERLLAEG